MITGQPPSAQPTFTPVTITENQLAAIPGIMYLHGMKFSLSDPGNSYMIRAYNQGELMINEHCHSNSVIIMPDRLITDWEPQTFEELMEDHFITISELEPQLVILGTGEEQQFPQPALYALLLNQGVGVEVMTTPAACRTYNILVSEGRRVAAALLLS